MPYFDTNSSKTNQHFPSVHHGCRPCMRRRRRTPRPRRSNRAPFASPKSFPWPLPPPRRGLPCSPCRPLPSSHRHPDKYVLNYDDPDIDCGWGNTEVNMLLLNWNHEHTERLLQLVPKTLISFMKWILSDTRLCSFIQYPLFVPCPGTRSRTWSRKWCRS